MLTVQSMELYWVDGPHGHRMEKGPHMQKDKQAEQHLCYSTKAVFIFWRNVKQ